MNDIKDLILSRIYDIKLLAQHKIIQSNSSHLYQPLKLSKINLHCVHIDTYSQSYNDLDIDNHSSQEQYQVDQNHPHTNNQLIKTQNKLNIIIKKRQKNRINKQTIILNALSMYSFLNQKQIEEFYFHSLQILSFFDPDFCKYTDQGRFLGFTMQQNLKKIFSFFFIKHDKQQNFKELIPSILNRQIWNLSPAFFFSWIRKWSISKLNSMLNLNEGKNQSKIGTKVNLRKIKDNIKKRNLTFEILKRQQKNSFNFIPKNKSCIYSPNKNRQNNQNKLINFQGFLNCVLSGSQFNEPQVQLAVNSKQIIYSYFLDDLKKYYKNLPLEDLDIGYLRNIKKIGKKQDFLSCQNIKNGVQTLIESKNYHIKTSIIYYQSEYQKFRPIISQINQKTQNICLQKKQTKYQQKQQMYEQEQQRTSVSLKDLQIKNISKLFDKKSKLLSPLLKRNQSFKNRIKFSYRNNEQICIVNKQKQINRQNSHSQFSSVSLKKQQNINKNKIFTKQISEQTVQMQNKLKLLRKIVKKNNNLKQKLAINGKKTYLVQDQITQKQSQQFYFLDQHIELNQKISKLPKLNQKNHHQQQCPEQPDSQIYQNYPNKKALKKQSSLDQRRLNKSQVAPQNKSKHKQQNRMSAQFNNLISMKNKYQENQFIDNNFNPNLYKRFLSQTTEKQIQNKINQQQQRPQSNFSIKSKLIGTFKKSSFNVIKFVKNKNSIINQFADCQNIQSVNDQMKNKFSLKHKIDRGIQQRMPTHIFGNEKRSIQSDTNKDEFIRYLKSLQKQKNHNQKHKNYVLRQKQHQIMNKNSIF